MVMEVTFPENHWMEGRDGERERGTSGKVGGLLGGMQM